MLAALTLRTLARHKWLIGAMAGVLAGFQVILVVIGVNLQRQGLFSQLGAFLPPTIQTAFGGSMIASFGGLVAFGFFHPIVVLALAIGAAYLAAELAGDVEEGLVDLLAARPVPRAALVARATVAMLAATALAVALMLAANRLSAVLYEPPGTPGARGRAITWLAVNLLAVTWCCGGIGLVLASLTRKRATAAGTATIAFITLYLLNFVATWWAPARPLARLAPFHYFEAMPIVMAGYDPTRHIIGLVVATALCVTAALIVYERRDL